MSETTEDWENMEGMPAEIDFSDSIPNPYIGRILLYMSRNSDGRDAGLPDDGSGHAVSPEPGDTPPTPAP